MRVVAFVSLAMLTGRTDAHIIKAARDVSFLKCTATSAQQDQDLVVLTLSARQSVALREGIRVSWAFGHSNVFFFVGSHGCSIPPAYRQQYTCQLQVSTDGLAVHVPEAAQHTHNVSLSKEDEALALEARLKDLILLPMIDSYRSLPLKLKLAYSWALAHTSAKWYLKIDDDSYVHVHRAEVFVASLVDEAFTIIAGDFVDGGPKARVMTTGKWAEVNYKGHPTLLCLRSRCSGHKLRCAQLDASAPQCILHSPVGQGIL